MSYSKALVTFFDILGFSEMVKNLSANEINAVLDKFSYHNGEGQYDKADFGPTVLSFSDSVVRVQKTSERSSLFFELVNLMHAQGELVAKGILVRGGMALGDVYVEKKRIFGPAFVEAYHLESKLAMYPRIVVSPTALAALLAGDIPLVHDLDTELEYIRPLLMQGEDGIWSIDYLRAFRGEMDDPMEYGDFLNSHLSIISQVEKACTKSAGLGTLDLKLNWLVNYHNEVVSELSDDLLKAYEYSREELTADAPSTNSMVDIG